MTPTKDREPQPFTPDDIVRAIEGVEKAGLQVYRVEVTPPGAIKIAIGPRSETGTAATIPLPKLKARQSQSKSNPKSKWTKTNAPCRCFDPIIAFAVGMGGRFLQ
jgi:hypothetical protein